MAPLTAEHFEERLSREQGDALDTWSQYVKFASSSSEFPRAALVPLLDRAIRDLNEPKYRADPRLLDIWVSAAALRSDVFSRVLFFETAFHRGIGIEQALLYERWSQELELCGDIKSAEATFEMGLRRSAQPASRLLTAFTDFQARAKPQLDQIKESSNPQSMNKNNNSHKKQIPARVACGYSSSSSSSSDECGAPPPGARGFDTVRSTRSAKSGAKSDRTKSNKSISKSKGKRTADAVSTTGSGVGVAMSNTQGSQQQNGNQNVGQLNGNPDSTQTDVRVPLTIKRCKKELDFNTQSKNAAAAGFGRKILGPVETNVTNQAVDIGLTQVLSKMALPSIPAQKQMVKSPPKVPVANAIPHQVEPKASSVPIISSTVDQNAARGFHCLPEYLGEGSNVLSFEEKRAADWMASRPKQVRLLL
mgnify:CR=1 FL=1